MKPIESVIQGNESTLYKRVYQELVNCGASDKFLKSFEDSHKRMSFDEFVDYCYKCLKEANCY